jgi:hypothetical protein
MIQNVLKEDYYVLESLFCFKVNSQKLFNILKKNCLKVLIKSLKKFKDHDLNNSVTKGGELAKKIVAV